MNAVTFLREHERMCSYYKHDCNKCKFNNEFEHCIDYIHSRPEEAIIKVKNWGEKHPEKVAFSCKKEMFQDNIVLISIKPKYCDLISVGKKLFEIRKSSPHIKLPFKCYIYCTKDTKQTYWCGIHERYFNKHNHDVSDCLLNGKIIGEFVCDKIVSIGLSPHNHNEYICDDNSIDILQQSCLSYDEMFAYIGESTGYGWHISNLQVYDKPKEIDIFCKGTSCSFEDMKKYGLGDMCDNCHQTDYGQVSNIDSFPRKDCNEMDCFQAYKRFFEDYYRTVRPPQSWCFVKMAEDYYRSIGQ